MNKMLIAAAALLAGSAALAQTRPPAPVAPPQAPVPTIQPVPDRTFTRAESVALVREHFGRLDDNKDGVITTAEISEMHGKFAERMKGMEGRKPHVMRFEREQRDPKAAFDRMDSNKDGAISRDEFAKAREERVERRIVRHEGKGSEALAHGEHQDGNVVIHRIDRSAKPGKDVRRHVRRMHGGRGFGGRMIVMADTDKDGRITLAEAEALALQHFDQMDTNRDGQVTPQERRAGRPMIIRKMVEDKKTAS